MSFNIPERTHTLKHAQAILRKYTQTISNSFLPLDTKLKDIRSTSRAARKQLSCFGMFSSVPALAHKPLVADHTIFTS